MKKMPIDTTRSDKEILVAFFQKQVSLLIPKKRGVGFLRQPLGHHACPLSLLAYDLRYDMFGLDGSLDIELGRGNGCLNDKQQADFCTEIVVPIAKLFNFPYRVVDIHEFWDNHPTSKKSKE